MRPFVRIGILASFALLFVYAVRTRIVTASADTLPPFTQIDNFPEDKTLLTKLSLDPAGTSNLAEVRSHGWMLFEGLVMHRDRPLWRDWYTECDLHLKKDCPTPPPASTTPVNSGLLDKRQLLASLRFPAQLAHGIDTASQAQDDTGSSAGQFASVLLNREAGDFIQQHLMAANSTNPVGDKLESILSAAMTSASPADGSHIDTFPQKAIAIKTSWVIVMTPQPAPAVPGVTPPAPIIAGVGIWDPANPPYSTASSHDNLLTLDEWHKPPSKSVISIDTNEKAACEAKDYPDGTPVPISCFYHVKITADDYRNLTSTGTTGILGDTARAWVPYYLILMGFHVTTKEIDDWTWETYYWSRRAFGTNPAVASDRSKREGNPADRYPGETRWSHYAMDTTLSDKPAHTADGRAEIVFNPYLEGPLNIDGPATGHGMVSNCLSCHRKAVYHSTGANRCIHPDGYNLSMSAMGKQPPAAENYFSCGLQTDQLWTLASTERFAAPPPPPPPPPAAPKVPARKAPARGAAARRPSVIEPIPSPTPTPQPARPLNLLQWIAAHPPSAAPIP